MKKFCLIILVSLLSIQAFAKLDAGPKDQGAFPFRIFFLSMKIKSHAIVEDRLIGRSAKKSKQYIRAQKLGKLASDKKLIKYCESKSPTLRSYSYALLCQRNHPEVFQILVDHQADSTCVTTFGGCIVGTMGVFDFMSREFEQLVEAGQYVLKEDEKLIFENLENIDFLFDCKEE